MLPIGDSAQCLILVTPVYRVIANVIIYTNCSIGLFPKSGTNELNQGRKDQILAKATQAEMTRPKRPRTKNDPDSGFRRKVLDFIFIGKIFFMGKKSQMAKDILARPDDISSRTLAFDALNYGI